MKRYKTKSTPTTVKIVYSITIELVSKVTGLYPYFKMFFCLFFPKKNGTTMIHIYAHGNPVIMFDLLPLGGDFSIFIQRSDKEQGVIMNGT